MELNQSGYSISELCKCARISRSSYYKWLNRKETQRDKENKEIYLSKITSLESKIDEIENSIKSEKTAKSSKTEKAKKETKTAKKTTKKTK